MSTVDPKFGIPAEAQPEGLRAAVAKLKRARQVFTDAITGGSVHDGYLNPTLSDVRAWEGEREDDAKERLHGELGSLSWEDIDAILAALASSTPQPGQELREDAQPYKDTLYDLVYLKAQQDIGCVPAPTKAQWEKAWAEAEELSRAEP